MHESVFHRFRDLAQRLAGISLRDGSETLVSARVATRMRELELTNEADYLAVLEGDDAETIRFLDAISTGFTSFWREEDHFIELADRARRDVERGQRRFRFWSAACSSGQEPYSMAIALEPVFRGTGADWKILATDLSTRRLARATRGVYSEDEVGPLGAEARALHLEAAGQHPVFGALFEVRAELKAHLSFRRLNLSAPPFPMKGPLDAIFCRNVMFYFDPPVRRVLVQEAERLLKPGGALYIGHSETLSQLSSTLQPVRPSVFCKREEAAK